MCCYIHHANWKYFIVYSMRGHSCLEKKIVGRFSRTHVKYAAKAGSEALLLTVLFCIKRKKKKSKGELFAGFLALLQLAKTTTGWPDPGFAQAEFKQQRFGRHAASPFIQHFGESRRSIGKTPHDYQETGLSPNHEVGRPPLRERSIQFLVSIVAKFERPLR